MTTDEENVREWYNDFVGVKNRDKIKWSELSRDEKKDLLIRSRAKNKVREGAVDFMIRRREDGLGTYSVDKHVVVYRSNELHREFLRDVGARREMWSDEKSRIVVRDEKGRIKTWVKEN